MNINKIIALISSLICCMIFSHSLFAYKQGLLTIANHKFHLQICVNDSERAQGLALKKIIAADYAMLFPFDKAGEQIFWMKDMLIAIDIVWLLDNKIVFIEHNVPPPSPLVKNLPTYGSGYLADAVLEFKEGTAQRLNLKIMQQVQISY